MTILNVLSHQSYGGDEQLLLQVFTSLVGSLLDYGSVVYGRACKTALRMLDQVLHLGLRLAFGAFRTSPIQSLYVECDKGCLDHQPAYTALRYAHNATSITNHPFNCIIQDTSAYNLFENLPSISATSSLQVKADAGELGVGFTDTYRADVSDLVPPWDMSPASCDMSFREINKWHAPRQLILQRFRHLQHKYPYTTFHTGDSKTSTAVLCAAHGPHFTSTKTLHGNTSIFTAEEHGILITMKHITQTNTQQSIIFTDSLSVVMALHPGRTSGNSILNKLIKIITYTHNKKLTVIVCWEPGHCGVLGNEIADQNAADAALRSDVDVPRVPQNI